MQHAPADRATSDAGCARCVAERAAPGPLPRACPECGTLIGLVPDDAGAKAPPGASPLVEMLTIAGPVVATMTSYTLMQFLDALMVSRIGPDAVYVAAQGNGAMMSFIPISIVMGVVTIVNTFVSQNLGAGRPERGAAYAWNGLWICAVAALLAVPYLFLLPSIFRLMGHGPELVRLESSYAQILLAGSFFTMSTRCLAHYFYGMHRPIPVFAAALTGNLTNLFLNWVLIFGNLGAPALGVTGAAIATVVGTVVELSIPVVVFLGPLHRRFGTRRAWRPSRAVLGDILRLGWPGGLMFGNEIFCWGYFMVYLVGSFGEQHNSAGWMALRYMHMSFMPAVGISIAVTAMVGRCMGMKRPDLAAQRAWLGLGVTMAFMGLCALAFVIFREPLIAVFVKEGTPPDARAELIAIGASVMIAAAVFQLFDALGICLSGALRGAGDTVVPGVATLVLSWSCIVGLGHAMIELAPGLGSLGPWIAASAYIILLGVFMLARFLRGSWRTMSVLDGARAGGH